MFARLKRWYNGEWKPFDDGSRPVVVGGQVEHHWTARVAHVLVAFWRRHWQWIIGTCITLVGLGIAWFKLLPG